MSEIESDNPFKCKKNIESDNGKQMNIKNEPHEELVNHECAEGILETDFLSTTSKMELNYEVIYIKEELKIENTEEIEFTNDEVHEAEVTDVNDGVEIKCEYTDISKNFYDQVVSTVKSEVDKSGNSCEVTKGVHRRKETPSPCMKQRVMSEGLGLNNKTQYCYKKLLDCSPTAEYNQNVHHYPIKKEILFVDENIFGSTSIDGNIEENLNAIDTGKISYPLNVSDAKNTNKTISITSGDAESSKTVFDCDMCDKSYKMKSSLIRHIKGHLNLYNCTYCSFKTYEKSSLSRHVNTKHTKNTVFNCTYCSYKTNDKSCLNRHVNAKHTKVNFYNCSYLNCDYRTYDKCDLNKHVNGKHTKSIVYNCSYCEYKAYDKSTLNSHVNAKHTKKTVYNCPHCEYKAFEKRSLEGHINAKHTKDTVYNCSYCNFKTYTKSILTSHVNAKHTKKTVYNCQYCSHKTYIKSSLSRHVNSKHTKNIVYNCTYCTFKTYIKSCLSKHVNSKHTKNTVYNCSYCSHKTCVKSSLSKHVRIKHSENAVKHTLTIDKSHLDDQVDA